MRIELLFSLVIAFGLGMTLWRGWFPLPFARVYRHGDGPLFWAVVLLLSAMLALGIAVWLRPI